MKKSVAQKDLSGCGAACVAWILDISYDSALLLFKNGRKYAKFRGFTCKEIEQALQKRNLRYQHRYIGNKGIKPIENNSIVFIKRSKRYPLGHYLVKTNSGWMNPWINFPNIQEIKSGFRRKLPGKPIYIVFRAEQKTGILSLPNSNY